jgi:hypothetical protein
MPDTTFDSTYSQTSITARRTKALRDIRLYLFGDDSEGISDAWIETYANHITAIIFDYNWDPCDPAAIERAIRVDLTSRGLL